MTNELIDPEKTVNFKEAYLEDSILSEKVIKMYNIDVKEYNGIDIIIHRPSFISISNPVIKEDLSTYMFFNKNTTVTIWKDSLIIHVAIR